MLKSGFAVSSIPSDAGLSPDIKKAAAHVYGVPFINPEAEYLLEQQRIAQAQKNAAPSAP